ncbi:MAG: SNF2-related protein, partial [Helicobacter sp.]|nr:SNF2-related protein [Helicobacter sp.]
VAPASLVLNWKSEILKFTNWQEKDISINSLKEAKIQILSYEGARINIEKLGVYEVLILDESQKIKNDKTQIFTAISQIKRDFTLILSGTPIENSLLDLWNMISAVNASFRWIYDNKIAPFASDSKKAINLSMQFLAPFIKRRTKDSVLKLPKRHTKSIFVEFSDEEKAAYDRIYNTFASILKTSLAFRLNYALLEGLLRLRQFCSVHKIIPNSLYNCQNLRDSKLEIVLKLVQKTLLKKQKIIIFSQFTKSLESLREALNRNDILYLNGSISKANRAKMIE